MKTIGFCKDCVHFKLIIESWLQKQCPGVGDCDCDKFVDLSDADGPDEDGLGYSDFENYEASFRVGPLFGCIHFRTYTDEDGETIRVIRDNDIQSNWFRPEVLLKVEQ